ncbi:hypothetical protein F5B22DRAFT_390034 [Xylaria bambusicola]|uniref:uncharacterized protein n=1 Tax=Xylaria bambusicola TaxID=326684 RepID=UPI0020077F79|nr:uncharacterized protein F5B22DRAFT_390034 [Xylaria bambusicola]KAI0508521.1 hypothetical protein F5B22DRAFT_390034 [Xylaria bambusicola]
MSSATGNSLGDNSENRGPPLRIYVVILFVVALIATGLRFWSRALYVPQSRQFHRFWWDDWIALAAAAAFTLEVIVTLLMIESGLGLHIWALSMPQLASLFKYVYAFQFVYAITIPLSKASALLFLKRIFPDYEKTAWFNVIVWVTHALNVGWFVGIVVASFLNCDPVEKNWKPWVPGTCRPTHELYLGSAVTSVFIDLIILLLPMPRVWRLRIGFARRCAVTAIFALGYTVVIASIGRLVVTDTKATGLETDFSYGGLDVFYWTFAESATLILCISLPAMPNLIYYLCEDSWYRTGKRFLSLFRCGRLKRNPQETREGKALYATTNE